MKSALDLYTILLVYYNYIIFKENKMSVSTHNLWKRRKNKPNKLVRSNKEWKRRANHSKLMLQLEKKSDKR